MCGGSSKSSTSSSSVSTPQSLNLGSPSLGGSSYALELGNAPNLTSATIYMTPPSQGVLQSLTSGPILAYAFLGGLAYLGYRMLR